MLSLSPCCPRPDRHVGAACTLLPRLKDPRLNFDELSAEEQFFLFEAPYLPRFTGSFPALSAWCDPAVNSHGFTFARVDRQPGARATVPQWRQQGSLYVAASGFATGYFCDRNEDGSRWRLVEYLAPGSFAPDTSAAARHVKSAPADDDLALPELDLDESPPAIAPAAASHFGLGKRSACTASSSSVSASDDGAAPAAVSHRKRRRALHLKAKSGYSCIVQLRSEQHTRLPLIAPAPVIMSYPEPLPLPLPLCGPNV